MTRTGGRGRRGPSNQQRKPDVIPQKVDLSEPRNRAGPEPVELSEELLGRLVRRFYARVRQDPLIGPVFNKAIGDWEEHLERLQAFWSSVMLTSGRYKGRPLPAHLKHADAIRPESFARWLALWEETTAELLAPAAAAAMQEKAARIAESLQLGMAVARGELGLSRRAAPAARAGASG